MKQGSKHTSFEQGLIEGRDQRSFEIARLLKREDIPADIILRATGITLKQIKELGSPSQGVK